MLTDRLRMKSTNQKKNSNKKVGAEILNYEKFYGTTTQISEENELCPAKWK